MVILEVQWSQICIFLWIYKLETRPSHQVILGFIIYSYWYAFYLHVILGFENPNWIATFRKLSPIWELIFH